MICRGVGFSDDVDDADNDEEVAVVREEIDDATDAGRSIGAGVD